MTVIIKVKVIQGHRFRYQSKAVCNFLLVSNTICHPRPISHHFQLLIIDRIFALTGGGTSISLTHSFVVNAKTRDYEIWRQCDGKYTSTS